MKLTRLLLITVAALLFLSGNDTPVTHAACNGFSTQVKPFAFEQITVSNVAIGFTVATLAEGSYALVTIETNPIRYRSDGTAPTAAVGHLASASTTIEVCGKTAARAFKMIRQGGADATAFATFYGGE